MRIETHIHTKYSHDSMLGFRLLHLILRAKKIDCVAITEHNNIVGALKFKEFCSAINSRIYVIVGEEIMTAHGEIIGLYLSEEIPSGLSPEETIRQIKKQNGLVYIPHPYDLKRKKTVLPEEFINSNCEYIDCIECHNGRNIKEEYSIRQQEIANKYRLPVVIGSDSHTWLEVGRNYMEFASIPLDAESFRQELKTTVLHKSGCLKISHTTTKFARLCKLLIGGKWNELCRIIIRKFKR